MAKHAEHVRLQPGSSLRLSSIPLLQTTLPRPRLRKRTPPPPLQPLLLPTRRRSPKASELRMPQWDGGDAWPLDCVSLGDAPVWRVRRWPAGGR